MFYYSMGTRPLCMIIPPCSGLNNDTKSSASLIGAVSKGSFRGLQLQEAEVVGCCSAPLLASQLGGFLFVLLI